MKLYFRKLLGATLALGLVASISYASDATPPAKKSAASKRTKAPAQPSLADQVEALRQALDHQASQIESLKSGMAEKDEKLRQAESEAAEAKAAAARAEAAGRVPRIRRLPTIRALFRR